MTCLTICSRSMVHPRSLVAQVECPNLMALHLKQWWPACGLLPISAMGSLNVAHERSGREQAAQKHIEQGTKSKAGDWVGSRGQKAGGRAADQVGAQDKKQKLK